MGRRLVTQRRGRGSPRYTNPSHRYKTTARYLPTQTHTEEIKGQIIEFINDPGHTAPIAKILLEDFTTILLLAPEGAKVGSWIQIGAETTTTTPGSIIPIGNVPEGTLIYNIEVHPGDGGKLVRSSGSSASVISHEKTTTLIRLPSKKTISIDKQCRVTIGRVAGAGRKDKFQLKAGQRYYQAKARGKLYPTVCGVNKNARDHPHGGGRSPHSGGGRTCVSKNTPPGRKSGFYGAKRTGIKRGSK